MKGSKGVKIGIVVIGLSAAGIIFAMSQKEPQAAIASDAKPIDLLCADCGNHFQMPYAEFIAKKVSVESTEESDKPNAGAGRRRTKKVQESVVTCPSCNASAARLASHCEEHDKYYPKTNPDGSNGRCPECVK